MKYHFFWQESLFGIAYCSPKPECPSLITFPRIMRPLIPFLMFVFPFKEVSVFVNNFFRLQGRGRSVLLSSPHVKHPYSLVILNNR